MGGGDRFVYPRIAGVIRKKIENREYPLGSKMPSERELAKEFYVNRLTVRRALAILESEGLIQRKQGAGPLRPLCQEKEMCAASADLHRP